MSRHSHARRRCLSFVKMSGAGNDFILLETAPRRGLPDLARRLCSRRTSVGADGLLVLRRGDSGRPRVEYYNADGSRAFCGNGNRCAAWWMHQRGWAGRRFSLETLGGRVEAVVVGRERVLIRMPEAKNIRLGLRLSAAGRKWTVHALDTGVPHAVVETRRLEDFPVVEAGRALRRHKAFGPAGANVNFMRIETARGPLVRIRTYERGVEDETLGCGTGVTACALCAHLLKGLRPPIRVHTRGGDVLSVNFRRGDGRFTDIRLEGPAKVTFLGEVKL